MHIMGSNTPKMMCPDGFLVGRLETSENKGGHLLETLSTMGFYHLTLLSSPDSVKKHSKSQNKQKKGKSKGLVIHVKTQQEKCKY